MMAQMTTKVLTIMCGDLGLLSGLSGGGWFLPCLAKFYLLHTVTGLLK